MSRDPKHFITRTPSPLPHAIGWKQVTGLVHTRGSHKGVHTRRWRSWGYLGVCPPQKASPEVLRTVYPTPQPEKRKMVCSRWLDLVLVTGGNSPRRVLSSFPGSSSPFSHPHHSPLVSPRGTNLDLPLVPAQPPFLT